MSYEIVGAAKGELTREKVLRVLSEFGATEITDTGKAVSAHLPSSGVKFYFKQPLTPYEGQIELPAQLEWAVGARFSFTYPRSRDWVESDDAIRRFVKCLASNTEGDFVITVDLEEVKAIRDAE